MEVITACKLIISIRTGQDIWIKVDMNCQVKGGSVTVNGSAEWAGKVTKISSMKALETDQAVPQ